MLGCLLVTLFLGWQASRVQLNASFEGMLPLGHPYLQNYLAERKKLVSQANSVRIVVERKNGESILDPKLPRDAAPHQRRRVPAAGRRPRADEVAVDAVDALDRRHRARLRGRPGHPRRLRRHARQAGSGCA
jgi:hypothetical protein